MGSRLSETDSELYKRIEEVLHYLWDPIGIAGHPGARDEYQSYLPRVFALAKSGAPISELAKYLAKIEEEQMGLRPNMQKASKVAYCCAEWNSYLYGLEK